MSFTTVLRLSGAVLNPTNWLPAGSLGQAAAHRPTGPGTTTAGLLPTLPARPVGNSGQAVPTHRAPHQEPAPYWIRGTLRLRGRTGRAVGQQRRRTPPNAPATSGHQSQGQRRHPLGAGHRAQDGAGIPLRRLARPKSKSSRRLPSAARFPSSLNCYDHPAGHRGLRCPGRHLHRGWEDGRKLSNRLELTVSGPGQ